MGTRIGINGFGRIGRNLARAWLRRKSDLELVAVNDLFDAETNARLLKYDSVHGVLSEDVRAQGDGITVGAKSFKVLAERDPAALPWGELGVEVVVESTGIFTDKAKASKHIEAGAKKVIISAPATEPDITVVMGVNDADYDNERHHVISNASCTTNCVVPMAKVLLDTFGIDRGFMTTVHAYTNDQNVQDLAGGKDARKGRAAALNIIPTSTGAARATSLVIPEAKGRLDGTSLRVPVPDGSITDLTVIVSRETTADEVNEAYAKAAASGPLSGGILVYTEEPIVSSDIVGNPASCIIDAESTMVNGNLVKVFGWYDNEWGYSNRLLDITELVCAKLTG